MQTKHIHHPAIHLNQNIRGLKPSSTLAINELSQQLQQENHNIYRLGLGQSPFPVPEIMHQALQKNAHQKDYLPVSGLPALRQAISNYCERTEGITYQPEHILIGPGTKELMFLVQLAYYGDLVIPAPSWVSYAPQAQIIGRHIRWMQTRLHNGMRIEAPELEKICQEDPSAPRLMIINYPNNPTGASYSAQQLQDIAEVARRYQVIVLSDEIYSGTHFDNQHISIARYYPEGTIISNGISKWAGAGGWRLGYFAFPESLNWLHKAMSSVASETYTSVSAPIQYASLFAFEEHDELNRYLEQSRRILKTLLLHVSQQLRNHGASLHQPEGGFYAFPCFQNAKATLQQRNIHTSSQLCQALLQETGVAALPGSDFGRPDEELSIRIACVDFDGKAALKAAETYGALDEAFLKQYTPRVLEAVNLLCEWINR